MIENFRPGMLERFGLGWDTLTKLNPSLTLVRISGFGQTGPYRDKPGFGAIGEAMGGIRYTTGDPDHPPARAGISLGDSLASLHAVIGTLISLLRVKTGQGRGQVVDVSLFESVFNLMESLVPEYDLLGHVRTRSGGMLPGISPSNTYRAKDGGYVVVAGNSDPIFQRLMTAIGRPDLAQDPALKSNDGRVLQNAMLDTVIGKWTATLSTDDLLSALDQADVPCGRIFTAADILDDPHYRSRNMILQTELPDGTPVKMPGITPKLSETPGAVRWPGPELGEHTGEVLRDLGYGDSDIEKLVSDGVIA
jgi:crotonobetainyl-CoA:carnitine CoA-transferase CaiB-like acyl-CoA transferase